MMVPAGPAVASGLSAACHAKGAFTVETASGAGQTPSAETLAPWNCGPILDESGTNDWTLRFDVKPGEASPKVLHTRLGHFDRLSLAVLDDAGRWSERSVTLGDVSTSIGKPFIYAELPEVEGRAVSVVATFYANGHSPTLAQAELIDSTPELNSEDVTVLLLFAALIGVLLIPIALDISIFLVVRKSFLLWHILLSLGFAGLIISRGNLLAIAVDVPANALRTGLIMSLSVTLAVALMFTRSFIEEGKINPRIKRLMPPAAVLVMLAGLFQASSLHTVIPFTGNLHAIGLTLGLIVLGSAMVSAIRAKSRSVIFQMFGWAPMLVAGGIQFITHFNPYTTLWEVIPLFFFGILFEGIATVVGVADRFLRLRRERDAAVMEARMLEKLSERDPLTGLSNRRAVEARFAELRGEGFDTFAVIDLDKFKQVNDDFGHQIGDKALIAAALALRGGDDRDTIAARLGGEEFVILLRGKRSVERAEALRQAIPVRIASAVEGLNRPITASMGVIALPRSMESWMSFDDLYKRADGLLYDAKAAGRNRTSFERLTLFNKAPTPRPPAGQGERDNGEIAA